MSRRLAVTVAMLVALMTLCALSVSAFGEEGRGGGDDEENESASDAPTRNDQIVFRRYFDPDQTKGALFTMNPTEATSARSPTLPKAGATMGRRGLRMGRESPSIARKATRVRAGSCS